MRRSFYLETFLISLAVILLEVSYTRVFSYKLVYYFTYLIIGISLLGLGSGGVIFALFERLRRIAAERLVLGCAIVAAAFVVLSYFFVAWTPLNLFRMVTTLSQGQVATPLWEATKLAVVLVTLFVPFLSAGVALATIFATRTELIGRLYFVDLMGAALGAAIVIPSITWISPPGTVFLSGLAFAVGALALARAEGGIWAKLPLALGAVLLVGVLFPGVLPDPIRDRVKGGKQTGAEFSRWSPVFRVDVVPVPVSDPAAKFLIHDGTIGSSLIQWDGELSSLGRYDTMDRAYPFRLLGPEPKVAIIGSAGGNEILASLHFGAEHVTGIELNPVTVSLLRKDFVDFTGHLAEEDRVTIVNAEGRSFLKSSDDDFDLIWLVAPDSYAAMNAATSGAFVLSESYLYTKEMIEEAVAKLTPNGILCAQFGEIDFDTKPNRVVRYLGTARDALAELGIGDFPKHVLVAVTPGFSRLENATILIKRSPFTQADIDTFVATSAAVPGSRVIYTWASSQAGTPITTVITASDEERERFYDEHPYKVHPITDDSPFFWHFVRFGDALFGSDDTAHVNIEEGIGERLLVVFLLIAIAFAAVFLLVPLLFLRRVWATIPYKWNAGIYFAALGLGFMFLEICLIQRLTLFLGYPTYSLTVTLFAILVSTGVGSLLSERYAADRNGAYGLLLKALVALVLFYELLLPWIMSVGVGWSFGVRVALTVIFLAPLGLCLGAFMPLGLRSVSAVTPYGEQYVAWCWAINGFFSVMASVLATLLSMSFGFNVVMLLGLAIYLIGVAAFRSVPSPGGPAPAAR
ncbi:MAG: class I SAM-dependent methyltransferase [Deltaproteobacteria bacterium]|nr:class I SAM-dependent methyltransferase [Deltaproteobacteria bacterium]